MDSRDFDNCLLNIESDDPSRRRQGVLSLERFREPRALQVARALVNDADETVGDYASRVCARLEALGIKPPRPLREDPPVEIESIGTQWELFDEVQFILRRNWVSVLYATVVGGFFKLLFAVVFLASGSMSRGYPGSMNYAQEYSFPLYFSLHFLLVRPFIWMALGKAIMGGFQDRKAAEIARSPFSMGQYLAFFQANLLQFVPIVLLVYGIGSRGLDEFPRFILAILLYFVAYHTAALMPRELLRQGKRGEAPEISVSSVFWPNKLLKGTYRPFLFFLMLCGLGLWANLALLLEGMGVYMNVPLFLVNTGILLIIDVILDPFWMGYKILTTRLVFASPQQEAEGSEEK